MESWFAVDSSGLFSLANMIERSSKLEEESGMSQHAGEVGGSLFWWSIRPLEGCEVVSIDALTPQKRNSPKKQIWKNKSIGY